MENNYKSCNICLRKMQSHSVFIECTNWHHVYHVKCINVDRNDVIPCGLWYCMYCLQALFTFNHIEDNRDFFSVIMECVSHYPIQFHEMNTKVFVPFEIIETTHTPFNKMDPDIQIYSSTHYALNTQCDYFIEDTLLTNITEKNQFQINNHYFISMWRACPNTMMSYHYILTHWTSSFQS